MTQVKISKEDLVSAFKEQLGINIKWPEVIGRTVFDEREKAGTFTTCYVTAPDFILVESEKSNVPNA